MTHGILISLLKNNFYNIMLKLETNNCLIIDKLATSIYVINLESICVVHLRKDLINLHRNVHEFLIIHKVKIKLGLWIWRG